MPDAIRLLIQQGALASYRVPVFRELAGRPGIRLKLRHAELPGLPNAPASGFEAEYVPLARWQIAGHPIYWHSAQWDCATPEHADVLLMVWDVHYASLVPALLRAKAHGVGTVLWGHGYSKSETPLRRLFRRKVADLATAVLFYSDAVAEEHIRAGWDPRRVFVARNALDQQPIQAARDAWLRDPAKLKTFQREQRLDDRPVILFVSRLDGQRKEGMLIEAAARLTAEFPRLQLVAIGQGPGAEALRQSAHHHRLAGHLHLPGAIYDEMQLAPWFLSATAFCFPVNIGLSLLHAFGYGLPVVTSDRIGDHGPEIAALRDGVNGLLYKDGSVDALAEQMARLLRDSELRQRMGREAHRTAIEEYSLSRMVDGMEEAVRYAAKHGARRA